jgi:hypothetical protein
VVVFLVAILIVGLRTTSIVDNMLTWFLGMVTFFAAELVNASAGDPSHRTVRRHARRR